MVDLAIWDAPLAEFFVTGLESGAVEAPVRIHRMSQREAVEALMHERVDIALVPTLIALTSPKVLDVLPAAALSTWKYPYAQILLRHGLQDIRRVDYPEDATQEALLARIVLKEHYGATPEFVPQAAATHEELAETDDASLVVGNRVPMLQSPMQQSEELALNLGEEWFELANYPMVWGVFAMRKGTASPSYIELLKALRVAAEAQRRVWVQSREMPPELHAFFADDLRVAFDDLATASLTELRQYLYYYGVTPDVPELPLYTLDDPDADAPDDAGTDDPLRPLL